MAFKLPQIPTPNFIARRLGKGGVERDEYDWFYRATEILNGIRKYLAGDVLYAPTGDLTSTDVAAAIDELEAQKVPYTGATGDVNLGVHDLSCTDAYVQDVVSTGKVVTIDVYTDTVRLDVTASTPAHAAGQMYWNPSDGTVDIQLLNNSTLQTGQEMYFYGKASGTIANGEVCQFAGVEGDHIKVRKAVAADILAYPHYLVGVATQNIANNAYGYITWFGKINGVYTKTPANNDSADWAAGDILYFDNTTGQLTKVVPDSPKIRIVVAAVIKAQTGSAENGVILVRPSFGIKFTECDDVDGAATESGQFYLWDETNKYFKPSSNIIIDDTNTTIYSNSNGGTAKDLTVACGTEKTLLLATPVWDDIIIPLVARAGAGNPSFGAFNAAGNLLAFRFSPTTVEQLYGTFEMPHTYKQESLLDIHVHWCPTTTGGGNVVWAMEYSIVNIDGTFPVNATITVTAAAGTTAWKHLYSDIAVVTGTGINLGAVCVFRLYRNASDGADTYAGDAALISFGVHIQHDTLGSRTELAK